MVDLQARRSPAHYPIRFDPISGAVSWLELDEPSIRPPASWTSAKPFGGALRRGPGLRCRRLPVLQHGQPFHTPAHLRAMVALGLRTAQRFPLVKEVLIDAARITLPGA